MDLLNGKGNLLDTYINCLEEHKVRINGEEYYLIKTFYATNAQEDFLKTFGEELDDNLKNKLDVIPTESTFNKYGVIYDLELKVVASFNMEYAEYSFDSQEIIFKKPEEVLIKYFKQSLKPVDYDAEQMVAEELEKCEAKVEELVEKTSGATIKLRGGLDEVKEQLLSELDNLKKQLKDNPRSKEEIHKELLEKIEDMSKRKPSPPPKPRRDYSGMGHAIMYAAPPTKN